MAKRILVPLDQSLVAESIVPIVADLARGGGASVRLLHVTPVPGNLVAKDGRVIAYADQEMERVRAAGLDYFHGLEPRFAGAPLNAVVRFGEPVDEILREAETFDADLIAVATAGRSGLGRVVLGSVAEQVFHRAPMPVMLFHPGRPSTR